MIDHTQLTALITALRNETAANSISPDEVGVILQHIADILNDAATRLSSSQNDINALLSSLQSSVDTLQQEYTYVASSVALHTDRIADISTTAVRTQSALNDFKTGSDGTHTSFQEQLTSLADKLEYLNVGIESIGQNTVDNAARIAAINNSIAANITELEIHGSAVRTDIDSIMPTMRMVAKRVGDVLYIGAKYDEARDILITFKKCWVNEIMTFEKVGLASNTLPYPLDNPDRPMDVVLNNASNFDNLGYYNVAKEDGHGAFVGGSVLYNNAPTTRPSSFRFIADGRTIADGETVRAHSIQVTTTTVILDPAASTIEGETQLSSSLCQESHTYTIVPGNIAVSVSVEFSNKTPRNIYDHWVANSMFIQENEIMTPMGAYPQFEVVSSADFSRGNYPEFRRYIERHIDNLYYQSVYIFPEDNGDLALVGNKPIFYRRSSKCYCRIGNGYTANRGDILAWNLLYTWFSEADVTAYPETNYPGEAHGRRLRFLSGVGAKTGYVAMPQGLAGKSIEVIDRSASVTEVADHITPCGLKITATGEYSLVIAL